MRLRGKRIFNYRPMLFFALSMVFGIILSEALYGESVWWYVALFLIFVAVVVCVSIFKNPENYFIFRLR